MITYRDDDRAGLAGTVARFHAHPHEAVRQIAQPRCPVAQPREPAELGLDLVQALRLLRRRWRLAALVTILGVSAATGLIALLPPIYRAEAIFVLDPRRSKIDELQSPTEALLSRTQSDLSAIRTEAEMVTAPTVLREVVKRLDLVEDKAEPAAARAVLRAGLALLAGWLASAVRNDGLMPSPAEATTEQRLDRAVEALGRKVAVVNEGDSYTLRVQAEAADPEVAARLANAVADVHLQQQRELQKTEREAQSAWLRERLDGLQRTVRESDAAVEGYRTRYRLAQGTGASTLDERINAVSSALTAARIRLSRQNADLAEAQRSLQRDDGQSAPAVLASPAIQELSVQEAALLGRRGELERTLGVRHPAILDIDGQLAGLRARIEIETRHIVSGLQAEVIATRNEIADLARQLSQLEDQREANAEATVELAELERRAAANREIYAQVLAQFSASLVRQAGTLNDVRLVAAARPPLEPAGPKRKLLAIGSFLASAALGALAALLFGFRHAGFGGAASLERATLVPTLELVPELSRRQLRRSWHPGAGGIPSIRSLAFTLHSLYEAAGLRPMLLLVTSALHAEGKSFCAGHLAHLAATMGQQRVLLAELDFWRPSVAGMALVMSTEPTERTIDGSMVLRDPATGLEILPADEAAVGATPAESFARRLAALRAQRSGHDLVILDAPPVLPIPDVLAAAAAADATLLVVRFERTPKEAVQATLRRLSSIGVCPAGTVLSRVVVRLHRRYGFRELMLPQSKA